MSEPAAGLTRPASPLAPSHQRLVQDDALIELCRRVRDALAGGAAVLPDGWPKARPVPPGTALIVATAGSTGQPRWVRLSAAALRASAAACLARIGGPGRWLLALPANHIAGLNVIVRALLAGALPVPLPPGPFSATAFAEAAGLMPPGPRFVSLVPTQLARLVADGGAALGALARFDAVLVGGASIDPALLATARQAGVRAVATYGMTETAGGCVYDGRPLSGVQARLAAGGRIELSGPVLADGYLSGPLAAEPGAAPAADDDDLEAGFYLDQGRRWFRTSDIGRFDPQGRLVVVARADDIIVSGGVKIAPGPVERVVRALNGIADAIVVARHDAEWGQAVTVLVTERPGSPPAEPAAIRQAVAAALGPAAAPKYYARLEQIPALPSGKPDRAAAQELARDLARPIVGPST